MPENESERGEQCGRKIREYIDCVDGKPFHHPPIQLNYDQRRIAQINHYIYTEKGRKANQEEIRTNRDAKMPTRKW